MDTQYRKLLLTDLDDTLLSSDKTISTENLEAIRKMTDAGHAFVLCTGRPLLSALKLAEKYHFITSGFYIASFNGGLIYNCNSKKEIYHEGIEKKYIRFLFDEAKKRNLHVHTYNNTHVLAERNSEMLEYYVNQIKMPYLIVDNVLDHVPDTPMKVIVADLHDHQKLVDFHEEFRPVTAPVLNSLFSNPKLLEYGSLKATKGHAVHILCDILNIPLENSIACGDEENDLSMIEAAGIGVAMANAIEKVKSHSDYVTLNDNNHHGIKEVIDRFILPQ